MYIRRIFVSMVVVALVAGFSLVARAEVVGHLTQVAGRVDILKEGKLPATPAKVNDPVGARDVIRTKSLSKAQITFIDNTILTISPESRISIEDYQVDTSKGKRHAVLEFFRGTALAVVNKIFQTKEPDFIIKTSTAIMGVRGTEFGVRILPASTTILNFKGRLQVGSVFPEVSQLFPKALKVAYASTWGGDSSRWVFLNAMQGTSVARNLPPTLPFTVTPQDRESFMRHLSISGSSQTKTGMDSEAPSVGASDNNTAMPGGQNILAFLANITVPPPLVPQAQAGQSQSGPAPASLSWVAIPVFNIQTVWGSGGNDLDLHLTGPEGEGTFHVYYNSAGSLTSQPYAMLNADDVGRSGSEVITVQQYNQGGPYTVYVFNYGDPSTTSTNLSTTAGVSVQIFNGGTVVPTSSGGSVVKGGTLVATLSPTPGQAGNTWIAVTIDPATGKIIAVNVITNTGSAVTASSSTTSNGLTGPSVTLAAVQTADASTPWESATPAATAETPMAVASVATAVSDSSSASAPITSSAVIMPASTSADTPITRPRADRRIIAASGRPLGAVQPRLALVATPISPTATAAISPVHRTRLRAMRPRVLAARRMPGPAANISPTISPTAVNPQVPAQLLQTQSLPQHRHLRQLRRVGDHGPHNGQPMRPAPANPANPQG